MNTKPSSMVSSMAVKVSYLSAVFQRLWSLGDAGSLSGLLKLIDEAVLLQRCRSRLGRMHRMLARYS